MDQLILLRIWGMRKECQTIGQTLLFYFFQSHGSKIQHEAMKVTIDAIVDSFTQQNVRFKQ